MATTNGSGVKQRSVKEERIRRRRESRIESHGQNNRTLVEFQPDAVEIEQRSVPGGARWTLYAVIGFMITFVAWSCWAQVDEIVVAQGKLVTSESTVVIQTFNNAPIRSINVKFGDRVKAGQVLATLDPTFSNADLKQLELKQAGFQALIARLMAERDGIPFTITDHPDDRDWMMQYQVYLERQHEYEATIRKFESDQNKVAVQEKNNLVEIEQNKNRLTKYEYLEKQFKTLQSRGSSSDVDVMSRELQTSDSQMQLTTSLSKKNEFAAEKAALERQQEAYVAGWRAEVATKLLEADQELSAVEQDLNKARLMSDLVELKVDPEESEHSEFVVFEVADRSVGSVLQAGEPLFKLIPIDVPLEAEVEIEGRDIAKIKTLANPPASMDDFPNGTKVTLKLNAFPFQRHDTLTGYVRTISEGAFEKQTAGGVTTIATFKARIHLMEPIELKNVGKDFRLMPGMTVVAEIKVGRRRVIQYFLYPLLRYLDESLREP